MPRDFARAVITRRVAASAVSLLLIILCAGAPAWSEAPDVKFLFPSGLKRGQSRTLKVNGKPGTSPLEVWTSDERLSGTPGQKGETIELTATEEIPPGVHWVRLVNAEGASELLPVVVGVISETTENELTDKDNPQPLVLPTTISGVLSKSGQVDNYKVTLEADRTIIASIDSRRLLGSPADVVLQLVDAAGFVVAQNDDHHDFDPQIVHTVDVADEYTVRVFAFPADPNSTIRFAGGDNYTYRLTLTTGPFIDHLFPLAVDSQGETPLHELGWNLPTDEPPLSVSSGVSGEILVASRHPGSLLANRLRPSSVAVQSEPETGAHTESVTVSIPAVVCGHIAASGQRDMYRFTVKKDQTLSASVAAQAFDSALDPVLVIRDAGGKVIKEADDIGKGNADVKVDVTFPADGDYTAEVSDRYGHGGMPYVYMLGIEEPRPQFRLKIAATKFVVTAEKPLEIPVTVDRLGGFAELITVQTEGLPEGVTAEPVESAKEGDSSKKVTVKVVSTRDSAAGSTIRIIGTRGDAPTVVATADTPIVGLTTESLWLTVVGLQKTEGE